MLVAFGGDTPGAFGFVVLRLMIVYDCCFCE